MEYMAHGAGRKAQGNEDTAQGIWCKAEGKKPDIRIIAPW